MVLNSFLQVIMLHSQRIEVYFSKGDTLYDIYATSNNIDDE